MVVAVSTFSTHRPATGVLPGFSRISGSVGQGGLNKGDDVRVVQSALNAVVSSLGGPNPPLKVDGIVGPLTIKAILGIQKLWTRFHDGRCDPGGPTLRVLNRLAGAAPPLTSSPGFPGASSFAGGVSAPPASPPSPRAPTPDELKAIGRLQFAQTSVMPVAVVAIVAAAQMLALAQQHIASVSSSPPSGPALRSDARLAFLFAAKHFRLHESDPTNSLFAVQQVTAVFARMIDVIASRTLTTPAGPRLDRLYSLAVVPAQVASITNVAYTGTVSGALRPGQPDGYTVPDPVSQTTMPEFCDGIYLLPGFDNLPNLPVPILIHELAHMCGGFPPESQIIDFSAASDPTNPAFAAQPRAQRLQNVRCYEFIATELLVSTIAAVTMFGLGDFTQRLPVSLGGSRLLAPPPPPGAPDPLAFPAGFA